MTAAETIDGLSLAVGPDVLAKRAALAEFVRAVLGRREPEFLLDGRVAERVHEGTADGVNESERGRVMGRPARYAEVLWRQDGGFTSDPIQGLGGAQVATPHTFLVAVYYGAGAGSEDAFTDLMESLDPAAPGLLPALRALPALVTAGGVVQVSDPDRVAVVYVPSRPRATGLARFDHEGAFTVTLL